MIADATLLVVTTAVLLARTALAVVFLVSALAKLRDRRGSRQAVQDFGVPAALVGTVAAGLPFIELACAALLLVADPVATVGAIGTTLLLAAFTVAIVVNLLRGNRVDCHCFGQVGAGSIGWTTVARNGVLLLLAGVVLTDAGSLPSVPAAAADYTARELLATAGIGVLVGAIVVLAVALRTLMGRYGGVLLRLEALETATGLTPPVPAPAFELPDLDGDLVALDDVLARQRPVLLVFISPSCALCSDLLPDLEQWQRDEDLSVLTVSTGTVEDNRTKLDGREVRVLLQDSELTDAYGMQGTPAAYLLAADGTLAAPTAYGVDAVRSLHDDAVRSVTGSHHHTELHQVGRRPVQAGDELPDVVVETQDGAAVALADAVGDDTVLLFWRTTCGFCASILDDVVALEASANLLLVTGTGTAELRSSGLTSPVLRETDGSLTEALQVPGTPSAVRVRAGVVASPVAVGGPAVLALMRQPSVVGVPS